MGDFLQDARYGVRALLKAPGFTLVAVLTLALGIGANTAIFSVVSGVVLRPLDYLEPERLMWFWDKQPDLDQAPLSAPDYLDFQAQNKSFENIAGVRPLNFNLTGQGDPERVRGVVVTANFFEMLHVTPALGRAFRPEEGLAGAPRVAVISHGFWQQRFGGDANIVGRSITLNEEPVTIIGVAPKGFGFISDAMFWLNPKRIVPEVFSNFQRDHLTMRGMHYLLVLGRLKPGATLAQAQADIETIMARGQQDFPVEARHFMRLTPLHEVLVGDVRPTMMALAVAVGFVLLIACANVANLLLARATARQREIAIRRALGAGRWRIVRQLLTESLLLAIAGGGLGLLIAFWGVDLIVTASPPDLPRVSAIRVDRIVLAFTAGISILAGLLFGFAPAFSASRGGLNEVLKEGGRGGSGGAQRSPLRSLLVVGEVALSLVLLTGAGLLLRSMARLLEVKPGFRAENLVTMWVSFASSKYSKAGATEAFARDLLPRLESLPGVEGVTMTNDLPLEGQDTTSYPRLEGRAEGQEERTLVGMHAVTPGYFRTMGVPLLRGRDFDARDASNAPPVVIINDAAAKKFWPGQDPIGKRVGLFGSGPNAPMSEIVGVVGDVKHNGLSAPLSYEAYAPFAQNPWAYLSIVVRTKADPGAMVAAVRKEVRAIDAEQPVYAVRTMDAVMGETLAQRRATLALAGVFAALALVLAAVGIYGVMSYAVSQRGHEIGIRIALGAQRRDIFRLIVGRGMLLIGAGVALGLVGAFGVTRFLRTLLFGVQPHDPLTFAAVAALLVGVALLACWLPARRATKVDPLVALRYE
jgi:predicted permease